ncbi:hypothetical protein [Halopiger xanaduensis]|uniref:hypothetical protein n=1 Tax=Halopiger xanaduensis TaxID=387343 RepID=UPI0011D26319|nr:hypothetical protein [Halopiger xanaduensis]
MVDDRPSSEAVRSKPEATHGRNGRSGPTLVAGFVALTLLVVAVVLGLRRREEPGLEPPF